MITAEARQGYCADKAGGPTRPAGAFWLVLVFRPAVLDGNPSEIEARLKGDARLSGRRSAILSRIEYETT
jgi:hypothetical protein